MACMLSRVASEHSSVVAVVGRGHLQGIKKNWNQPIKVSHSLFSLDITDAELIVIVLMVFADEGSVGDTEE